MRYVAMAMRRDLGRTCQNNTGVHYVYLTWQEDCRPRFEKTERGVIFETYRRNSPPIPPISTRQSGGTISDSTGSTLLTTDPWGFFFEIVEPTYLKLTMEFFSTFYLQTVMTRFDDLGMVQFRLGSLVCQLSDPEFDTVLGLYTEEFMEENELHTLNRHIHHSPSRC
ncbi:hypothetical protein PVK06_020965 [Gossypium arboreum]|uniref:Uncharacterized protein n=1 Tax=Gossypium arboreum TaxID=29729 RepID=A0ABR0PP72_GOSAR|nr:hypothetical protein PVK06_020965 [Gossypium arboreum]